MTPGKMPNNVFCNNAVSPFYNVITEPVPEIWNDILEETNVPLETADTQSARLDQIFLDVDDEVSAAVAKFPAFNSAHEGFSVLAEEVDELWDEVKAKQGARDLARLRKEAVQVAAMAIRFILDVCDGERGQV